MARIRTLDDKTMPFLGHLEELRSRLLWSVGAIVIGMVFGWFLAPYAMHLLILPIEDSGLLPKDDLTLEMEIQPVGETGQLVLAVRSMPPSPEPVDTPLEQLRRVTRIEYYMPGGAEPFAVMNPAGRSGVIYLRPIDPFMVRLKVALLLGVVLALPVIFYEVYAFVAPGLLPQEKRWVGPCYFAAMILFPIGAAFAYYMLKFALLFFARYAAQEAFLFNDIKAYLNFVVTTMLAFGVVFELPLGVLLLTKLGVVSVHTLASRRKHVFVILLIIAAVATPTGDPFTLAAMTLPLYGLFEISLLVSRITSRPSARQTVAEEAEEPNPSEG